MKANPTIEGHIFEAFAMFSDSLLGRSPSSGEPTDDATTLDRATVLRRSVRETLAAWSTPGRMFRPVQLPFGEFPARLADEINHLETFVRAPWSPATSHPFVGPIGITVVAWDLIAVTDTPWGTVAYP